MDQDFLCQILWQYAIIDEAQWLRKPSSVMYNVLSKRFLIPRRLLMTGTPIQNNLTELWALMHFCMPSMFGTLEQFLFTFKEAENPSSGTDASNVKEHYKTLKHVLRAFMLRRTKAKLMESGIGFLGRIAPLAASLQKKVYMSILKGELPKLLALSSGASPHQPLQNVTSGKLLILDQLLQKLHESGHCVLLFAQMTHTLNILQDFMELWKYSYERLYGSIRAEKHFAAIRSFSGQSGKEKLNGLLKVVTEKIGM